MAMDETFPILPNSWLDAQPLSVHNERHVIASSLTDEIIHANDRARRLVKALEQASGRRDHLPDVLTSREISVARGVAAGLTNKQIGAQLNVSEGTVKEYVKRVRMKLGHRSRGTVRTQMKNVQLDGSADPARQGSSIISTREYLSS